MSTTATRTQASQRPVVQTTKSSGANSTYVQPTIDMLTDAFSTDPLFTYMLHRLSPTDRNIARGKIFTIMFTMAAKNDAIFYESHTGASSDPPFQCAAIVSPPGKKADDMGFMSIWGTLHFMRYGTLSLVRMLGVSDAGTTATEYSDATEPVKKKYFDSVGAKDYYEIKYIATDANHRRKGLAPALIRDVQATAAKEGKPVWLDASNRNARGVYLKCGFKDADEPIILGKGLVNREGIAATSEEALGVEIFPMVWWPEETN